MSNKENKEVKFEEKRAQAKINREERKLNLKEAYTDKKIESHIEKAFRATVEATEEAVLRSMLNAKTVVGYSGKVRRSLAEFWQDEE